MIGQSRVLIMSMDGHSIIIFIGENFLQRTLQMYVPCFLFDSILAGQRYNQLGNVKSIAMNILLYNNYYIVILLQ